MSLLTRVASSLVEARKTITDNDWGWRLLASNVSETGIAVNEESSRKLPVVYCCRRLIAYGIASLPVDVLVKEQRRDGVHRLASTSPPRWVDQPNAEQLWPEFCAQAVDSLLADGNLFIDTGYRNQAGYATDLFVLNPRRVVTVRERDNGNRLAYSITTDSGLKVLGPERIKHIKALTPAGEDRGLSPITAAMQTIGIGLAQQAYEAKFYANGGTMSALLTFPEGVNKEAVKDYVEAFRRDYTGVENMRKVGGLGGGAKYEALSITQEQAQYIESRTVTGVDIATRIYGVPPHRAGYHVDKPQFGNNLEQSNLAYVADAWVPWLALLEANFRRPPFMKPPSYLKFNLTAQLRGDSKARAAFYQALQQLGDINSNEVRAWEDLNPYPGGHVYRAPLNLGVVGADGVPILPDRTKAFAKQLAAYMLSAPDEVTDE